MNTSLFALNQNNLFARIGIIFYHLSAGFLELNISNLIFAGLFVLAVALFGILLYSGIKFLHREDSKNFWLLFLLIAIPTAILLFIWAARILLPYTYARYLLNISPFYYILLGFGITSLASRFLQYKKIIVISILVLILALNAVPLYKQYFLETKKEDWRSAAKYIETNSNSNEIIAFYPSPYIFNFFYYYKGGLKVYAIPSNIELNRNTISFEGAYMRFQNIPIITEENKCSAMKLLDNSTSGIWLVEFNPDSTDKNRLAKGCLESNLLLKGQFETISKDLRNKENLDIIAYHFIK